MDYIKEISLIKHIEKLTNRKFRKDNLCAKIITNDNIKKIINMYTKNINDINDCNWLIDYFNTCNSSICESYWVLRKNKTISESKKMILPILQKFVKSPYTYISRSDTAKSFVKQNKSRGYAGWVYIMNYKFYCRSKGEFIMLHYLINKYGVGNIKMECQNYIINNISYKPDFFIFQNNKLIEIIEIKYSKTECDQYIQNFKPMFDKLGIKYNAYYNVKPYYTDNILNKLKLWIQQSSIKSNSGSNNPMWGKKQTNYTKNIIREKCIQRNKNPEYRKKLSQAQLTHNLPKYKNIIIFLKQNKLLNNDVKSIKELKYNIYNFNHKQPIPATKRQKIYYFLNKVCGNIQDIFKYEAM